MDGNATCRDRFGYFPPSIFQLWTCSMCYSYLFQRKANDKQLVPNWPRAYELRALNGSVYPVGHVVIPDMRNKSSIVDVCRSLDGEECTRWQACCNAAEKCCEKQVAWDVSVFKDKLFCPATWDGFGCFKNTPAGETSQIFCPSYIQHAIPTSPAYKSCTVNGTWWTNPKTTQEWTDYTHCVQMEGYKGAWITGVVCDAVSLSLLIPACLIFLGFRQLRRQQRIKLHLSLFLSFILTSLVRLLWDILIFYERMSVPAAQTAMGRNTSGCILLYVLTRYARTTNFFWMFAEGFYLHRLLAHAFDVPKTLIPYYVFGWGISSIPMMIYSIVRASKGATECWVQHAGALEWVVYTPNLLCLILNLIILCHIIGIMLTQLQSHPNEPSTYRRALKAAFILVPLFGLQLFAVLYRPPPSAHSYIYEIFSRLLKNLQGAAIALVFCFLNGEVMVHLKTALHRIKSDPYRSEFTQNMSMTTTVDVSRPLRDGNSPTMPCKTYIPLNTIDERGLEKQNGDI